ADLLERVGVEHRAAADLIGTDAAADLDDRGPLLAAGDLELLAGGCDARARAPRRGAHAASCPRIRRYTGANARSALGISGVTDRVAAERARSSTSSASV